MSYDMKAMNNARKEVKDIEIIESGKVKLVSIEKIERTNRSRDKKRTKLMKEARKVLNFDEMCKYIEGEKFEGLEKLPVLIEVEVNKK